MTNKEFAWKIFCEAQWEFLIGLELKASDMDNMFGKQLYDLILQESLKMSENERWAFMNFHCDSFDSIGVAQ